MRLYAPIRARICRNIIEMSWNISPLREVTIAVCERFRYAHTGTHADLAIEMIAKISYTSPIGG